MAAPWLSPRMFPRIGELGFNSGSISGSFWIKRWIGWRLDCSPSRERCVAERVGMCNHLVGSSITVLLFYGHHRLRPLPQIPTPKGDIRSHDS
jgi:hypothetical protein